MEKVETFPKVQRELCRFLYICQNVPKYWAGKCKLNMKFPSRDLFSKIVEDPDDAVNAVEILRLANDNSTFRIPVIYAAAVLIVSVSKEKEFLPARNKMYALVPAALKNSDELFLFTKFTTDLGLKKGSRWQKCMHSWYATHGANIFFKDLTIIRSRYGWTHKDICNLLHMPNSTQVQLCLAYVYGGIDVILSNKLLMEKYKDTGVKDVKIIDQLRKCQKIDDVTLLVKNNEFVRYLHVPDKFLYGPQDNTEIWTILIKKMNITEILDHIPKLLDYKKGKDVVPLVLDIETLISDKTASPYQAFITYCNYKNYSGVVIKKKKTYRDNGKGKKEDTAKDSDDIIEIIEKKITQHQKRQKRGHVPCKNLLKALLSLTERSLQATELAIDARCLITLDMRDLMFISPKSKSKKIALQSLIPDIKPPEPGAAIAGEVKAALEMNTNGLKPAKCYYNKNVIPGQAGILLALHFLKYVKNTTVAIFTHEGIEIIDLYEKNEDGTTVYPTMEQAEKKLKIAKAGRAALNKPFEWAKMNEKEFDLFINVVDTPTRIKKYPKPLKTTAKDVKSALLDYKESMKLPKTKTVTITLSTQNAVTTDDSVQGILDISGFDEHIPGIIKNFIEENFN